MNPFDKEYHALLERILEYGVEKKDRTGTGTKSVFGHMMRFDLSKGFPLITTKKVHLKSIIHELLWMLSGSTNIKYLQDNGVRIWNEWADENGDLGPVYGSGWRAWPRFEKIPDVRIVCDIPGSSYRGSIMEGEPFTKIEPIDQVAQIVETLRKNPWSRRIMLSAWNVSELPKMKLPPCHFNAQFNVTPGVIVNVHVPDGQKAGSIAASNRLNCLMSIRSWDVFLGGPFNIAQYALLTMMLAQVTNLEPGELIISSGDTHLYLNHIEQAKLQTRREPKAPPRMIINPEVKEIDDFTYEHFELQGYDPHPSIKAEISV